MKKTLLVTGGTGFLGKRLALALQDQYEVVLTGRNNKQNQAAAKFTGCTVIPMDVARVDSVRDTFREVCPAVVIHAAATKFVDLAEKQPMECVDVNVLGSQNIARMALEHEVETVIGVSTDKATPPVRNTYGLSKAIMERVFCSMNGKTATKFACACYGNVAWSTGSVLPVWKAMHSEKGVIGTTGPEMTRFFFTVDEAVALVTTLLARIDEFAGLILSREMKAALIQDLLETWVDYKDGSWERIDGRPGERLDELLVGEKELDYAKEHLINGVKHYSISFTEKSDTPLTEIVSSATAARLTTDEMPSLIDAVPPEEV